MKLYNILIEESGLFKKWTVKYRNSLPNSAFTIIEPAYLDGETLDKRARHLPYRDITGKIDKPHLRNALARANQIKAITDSITTKELRKQAKNRLDKIKKQVGW